MTKEDILESLKEVIKVVRPTMDVESVGFDSRLREDLALDSLSMMLTAMAIENKFGIRFEPQHIFNTVGDVCDIALELIGK